MKSKNKESRVSGSAFGQCLRKLIGQTPFFVKGASGFKSQRGHCIIVNRGEVRQPLSFRTPLNRILIEPRYSHIYYQYSCSLWLCQVKNGAQSEPIKKREKINGSVFAGKGKQYRESQVIFGIGKIS